MKITDEELEPIIIKTLYELENDGICISKDCEITLARFVAKKIRDIYEGIRRIKN